MIASTKRYRLFCGIDAHKRTHVACVLDADAQVRLRPGAFANDAEGFRRLDQRLGQLAPADAVLTGMEATGHYWYCLHEFLRRRGYDVAVLNPIQTAQQARKGIRKTVTDKTSARHIAMLLRNGEYRPASVPGDLATTCRFVTRLRYALVGHLKRTKQLLRARLHPAWPEYETYFVNPFCRTSRALLAAAPTPQELRTLPQEQVAQLLRTASRGRLGAALAERIFESAAQSVGIQRGLEGIRICLSTLLGELDALDAIRKELQGRIEQLADRLPPYLRTLPGATALHAASLYGEIDPVQTFATPGKLVAFAGLDVAVHQSGQGGSLRGRISKRGSPFLRQTLWLMAHRAVYLEGDLRDYFLRKRAAGLHYLAAVTAAAVKLTHVVWRIMTDGRDYLPAAPSRRS